MYKGIIEHERVKRPEFDPNLEQKFLDKYIKEFEKAIREKESYKLESGTFKSKHFDNIVNEVLIANDVDDENQ